MARRRREGAQRNAGAFMGPGGLIPVPMRTLSDDYADRPAEPEEEDEAPPPGQPGLYRRIVDRLARRAARPR